MYAGIRRARKRKRERELIIFERIDSGSSIIIGHKEISILN